MSVVTNIGSRVALLVDGADDIDFEIEYKDSNGDAVDITGFQFSWTFTIGEVTLTATTGNGKITTEDLEGKIIVHFEAAESATLPQGLGEHRLRITLPVDKTLIRGALVNDN